MKRTYLTPDTVNMFCNETHRQRLRDLVERIKQKTGQGFSGSYPTIFNQIVENGVLDFCFDESQDSDCDNEISEVRITYTPNAASHHMLISNGYMSAIVDDLPTRKPNNQPTQKPTGATKMSQVSNKAKEIGGGMVAANKQAFGMAASMQTGRANNKVIKEAVRPLVKLMFKPSFMQRILAKLFKTENPIDKFLDSPYGSLFAAQLAQGIVTMKGVENENVKKVTVGGIAYAYNELADEIVPLEKAIDSVVDKISEAAKLVK